MSVSLLFVTSLLKSDKNGDTSIFEWYIFLKFFKTDILIWRAPNLEKFAHEIFAQHWIAIWGLGSTQIKKLKRTDPHLLKKCVSVFFNLFIWALLRPQIAIWWHTIFSHILFSWFCPLQIKTSWRNYMVITLSECLTILAIKIMKMFNLG